LAHRHVVDEDLGAGAVYGDANGCDARLETLDVGQYIIPPLRGDVRLSVVKVAREAAESARVVLHLEADLADVEQELVARREVVSAAHLGKGARKVALVVEISSALVPALRLVELSLVGLRTVGMRGGRREFHGGRHDHETKDRSKLHRRG